MRDIVKKGIIFFSFVSFAVLSGCSKKEETTTITMLCSGTVTENDYETEIFPKLVNESYPDIKVEVVKLPDNQYSTALQSKLASGECSDIILVQPMYASSTSVLELAAKGYLEPITDMEAVKLAGIGADSFTYNGEVYGIPTGVTILGTYYNQDLFSQYNLEIPKSWEEFLNVCETLKVNGVQPIVMGDKDKYEMQFGLYQIAANEIYTQNENYDIELRDGSTNFTDEGTWDKVLSMYTELYEKEYIAQDSVAIGNTQAIQRFTEGKAAMIFGGSFDSQNMTSNGNSNFNVGYFPLPGTQKDIYAAMCAGPGPAIYSKSEHKEECKKILELMYDGESELYQEYVNTGRFIPTYGYGSDQVDSLYDNFFELYKKGNAFYWCNQAWPSGVAEEMETLFSQYIVGQIETVEDITAGMQKKFDESLGKGE